MTSKCPECGAIYPDVSSLMTHYEACLTLASQRMKIGRKRFGMVVDPKYQCMACGMWFVDADNHHNHTRECIAKPEEIIVEDEAKDEEKFDSIVLDAKVTVLGKTRSMRIELPFRTMDDGAVTLMADSVWNALTRNYVDKKPE